MSEPSALTALIRYATSVSDARYLDAHVVQDRQPGLYEGAVAAYGTWTQALAAALIQATAATHAVSKSASSRDATSSAPPIQLNEAPDTRQVTDAADDPLYLLSDEGHLSTIVLSELEDIADEAWEDLPEGPGREAWPAYLHMGSEDTTFFALAGDGTGSSLHGPHFTDWAHDARPSRYADRIRGATDAPVVAMFPRRMLRLQQRLYAVATDGQIKASDCSEYAKRLGNEAIDVILPRGDARAFTMFAGPENATILMASSGGKAIVFEGEELRSQGLKAQGVRGIKIEDDERIIGAFDAVLDELILITEHGYTKRMPIEEFRPQGRGGGGLQTCKLSSGDRVMRVLQATINDDVLVVDDGGQYKRVPVWMIPSMGRAARGDLLLAPQQGAILLDACVVPAGQ